jgi:hypothetical protein
MLMMGIVGIVEGVLCGKICACMNQIMKVYENAMVQCGYDAKRCAV